MNFNAGRIDWLREVEQSTVDALKRHGQIALLYSGGIKSSLLLQLMAPWRSRITVYNVRTGVEFPHMVAFMDRKLHDWDHSGPQGLVQGIGLTGLGRAYRALGGHLQHHQHQ